MARVMFFFQHSQLELWSVLRPSVGSTNSAKSSTCRAALSGERGERGLGGQPMFVPFGISTPECCVKAVKLYPNSITP